MFLEENCSWSRKQETKNARTPTWLPCSCHLQYGIPKRIIKWQTVLNLSSFSWCHRFLCMIFKWPNVCADLDLPSITCRLHILKWIENNFSWKWVWLILSVPNGSNDDNTLCKQLSLCGLLHTNVTCSAQARRYSKIESLQWISLSGNRKWNQTAQTTNWPSQMSYCRTSIFGLYYEVRDTNFQISSTLRA